MKNENKLYIIFIILSLLFGTIFSILIPMYQVPDEEYHINTLYSYLGENIDFLKNTNYYGDTNRIISNYDEKVNINNYINLNEKLNCLDLNKIKNIDIHIIRYLPQALGIIISEIFKFPIIISITISELLAVAFYTFICLLSLKKMPIKKEVFMAIMLLPIGIQQMGSFSYDMMLNSFSFLFIANIYNLIYNKSKINNIDLLKLLLILIIICLIKVPYILLGILIIFLPKEKVILYEKINKMISSKKIILVLLIIALLITAKYAIKIKYIKILIAFLISPLASTKLIIRTLLRHLDFYLISIMGYFGWHDTPVSIAFAVFIFIGILIINFLSKTTEKIKIHKKDKYIFLIGIICSIVTVLALFDWTLEYLGINTLNFTINNYKNNILTTKEILGVQGRYFIPYIPLLIIPFNLNINKIKIKDIYLTIFQIIYYLVLFFYIFIIILNRYWI